MTKNSFNYVYNKRLSGRDKEVLSTLSRKATQGLIDVRTASEALGLSGRETALKLAALDKKGWLRRVKRGTYFILPLEATKKEGGVASDPWIIASVLFAPCYIGGWSAAEYFELTEQIFRSTFVVSAASVR